jgi:hypothetical protein
MLKYLSLKEKLKCCEYMYKFKNKHTLLEQLVASSRIFL